MSGIVACRSINSIEVEVIGPKFVEVFYDKITTSVAKSLALGEGDYEDLGINSLRGEAKSTEVKILA